MCVINIPFYFTWFFNRRKPFTVINLKFFQIQFTTLVSSFSSSPGHDGKLYYAKRMNFYDENWVSSGNKTVKNEK